MAFQEQNDQFFAAPQLLGAGVLECPAGRFGWEQVVSRMETLHESHDRVLAAAEAVLLDEPDNQLPNFILNDLPQVYLQPVEMVHDIVAGPTFGQFMNLHQMVEGALDDVEGLSSDLWSDHRNVERQFLEKMKVGEMAMKVGEVRVHLQAVMFCMNKILERARREALELLQGEVPPQDNDHNQGDMQPQDEEIVW